LAATNDSKLILNGFFGINSKNKTSFDYKVKPKELNLNTTGIWKLDIDIDDYNSSKHILTRKFLVIPEETPFGSNETSNQIWSEMFSKFWKISSVCLKNKSQFKNDLGVFFVDNQFIEECEETAYWSSFYPDPKSDFNHGSSLKTCNQNSERIISV